MQTKPDMEAILNHYGIDAPTKSGWAPIRCPIHNDLHASAAVNMDEQAFHCFTCNIHGDVYTIIQQKENVGFKDAVKLGETYAHGSVQKVHHKQDAGLLGISRSKRNPSGSRRYVPPRNVY